MTIETHAHRARERVSAEREATAAKIDAFEAFERRIADVPTTRSSAPVAGAAPAAGPLLGDGGPDRDPCRDVRTAFAETVRPHSVDDVDEPEPLLETVRSEFTASIAMALSPATDATFTEACKRSIVAESESRRHQARVLATALEREADDLADALEAIDAATDWIARADETPLPELGFDDLRSRHRRLSAFRDRCAERARDRQEFLDGATTLAGAVAVRHREVTEFCYDDFPVDYPLLATLARLIDTCESCQRTVRAYLVRSG